MSYTCISFTDGNLTLHMYYGEAILRACEPEPLFASPERFPPKNKKNGHNALIWFLYMRALPPEDCNQVLFLFRIPNISEEKYGNDELVYQK